MNRSSAILISVLLLGLLAPENGFSQTRVFYSGHLGYQDNISAACRATVWAKNTGHIDYWFEVYRNEQLWLTSSKGRALLHTGKKIALDGDTLFDRCYEANTFGNYQVVLHTVFGRDTAQVQQAYYFSPLSFPVSGISVEVIRGKVLRPPKLSIRAGDSIYGYQLVVDHKSTKLTDDRGLQIPFQAKKNTTLQLLIDDVPICDTTLNGLELLKIGWKNKIQFEGSAINTKADGVVIPEVPETPMPEIPKYEKPSFGTTIYFEAKTSTLDSLYGYMPNNYLRTGIAPSAELMGIPFKGDFYYTTESGTGYDLNSFSLGIDAASIKDQVRKEAFNNTDSVNQLLQNNQCSTGQLSRQLNRHQLNRDELIEQKRALEGQIIEDASSVRDSLFSTQSDSALHTIKGQLKSKKLDSLNASRSRTEKRLNVVNDSLDQLNDQINMAKSEAEALQTEYSRLQAEGAKWRDIAQNPHSLTPDAAPAKDKALGYLSKIDQLQVGRHNVDFLPEVAEGVNIRGITVAVASKDLYIKSSKGRYTNSLDILADQNALSYNKSLFAIRAGRGMPAGNHLHGLLMKQNLDEDGQFENYVSALTTQRALGTRIEYAAILASSSRAYFNQPGMSVLEDALDLSQKNYFFNGKLEGALWKDAKLHMGYTQVGANFNSAVSPFLRTDRATFNTGVETSIGDHFDVSLAYQREKGIGSPNNLVNGLSFNVLFSSLVLPTIQVSYLPFQQTIDTKGSQQVARNDFATLSVLGFRNFDLGGKRKLKVLSQYIRSEYSLGLHEDARLLEQINTTINFDISTTFQAHLNYGYALVDAKSQNKVGGAGLRFTVVNGLSHQVNFTQNYAPLDDATRTTFSVQNDYTKGIFSFSVIGGFGNYINNPFVSSTQEFFTQLRCRMSL